MVVLFLIEEAGFDVEGCTFVGVGTGGLVESDCLVSSGFSFGVISEQTADLGDSAECHGFLLAEISNPPNDFECLAKICEGFLVICPGSFLCLSGPCLLQENRGAVVVKAGDSKRINAADTLQDIVAFIEIPQGILRPAHHAVGGAFIEQKNGVLVGFQKSEVLHFLFHHGRDPQAFVKSVDAAVKTEQLVLNCEQVFEITAVQVDAVGRCDAQITGRRVVGTLLRQRTLGVQQKLFDRVDIAALINLVQLAVKDISVKHDPAPFLF